MLSFVFFLLLFCHLFCLYELYLRVIQEAACLYLGQQQNVSLFFISVLFFTPRFVDYVSFCTDLFHINKGFELEEENSLLWATNKPLKKVAFCCCTYILVALITPNKVMTPLFVSLAQTSP